VLKRVRVVRLSLPDLQVGALTSYFADLENLNIFQLVSNFRQISHRSPCTLKRKNAKIL
jgi:hypothetical protein